MKTLFRLLVPITALALLAGAGSARAEETTPAPADTSTSTPVAKGKGKRAGQRAQGAADNFQQILKDFDLTKDQKAKIAEITKKEVADLKAVQADASISAKQKRQKTASIRETTKADVRALLTSEQQEKFDKALAARSESQPASKKGGKRSRS